MLDGAPATRRTTANAARSIASHVCRSRELRVRLTYARGTPNSSTSLGLRLSQLDVAFGTSELASPCISPTARTVTVIQPGSWFARCASTGSTSGIMRKSIASEPSAAG